MLLSRKRLHKIKKIKNQSMKRNKGGKIRKRKRNKSFSNKKKSFNLRNRSLKKMRGGTRNNSSVKFFFLMPIDFGDKETTVALVGIKNKKKATQMRNKFAKPFSKGFGNNMSVSVVNALKDRKTVEGYTKLYTFSLERQSKERKLILQDIQLIHGLNHSIFQFQEQLFKQREDAYINSHDEAKTKNNGTDPCGKYNAGVCKNKTEDSKPCRWSTAANKCRSGIPKGSINIYNDILDHIKRKINPGEVEANETKEEKKVSNELRLAEEKRVADEVEMARLAEVERLAEEKRVADGVEVARLADVARLAEEKRVADEAEEKRLIEPTINIPVSNDCDSKRDCGDKFCLQPTEGGNGKCVPKTVYVSNMRARKGPKEVPIEENVEELFNFVMPKIKLANDRL